tara:strand:+ start:1605 stop:2363 length:759 start_codon:yes stop_codon:yes gene_type:complete
MNKIILTFLFLIFSLTDGFSQESETEHESVVAYFIDCIKRSDIDQLDAIISYPFKRPYPVPSINDKQELTERYLELFDDSLTSIITNSIIKEDWKNMGWRGVMLHNGIVWLDYDGRLITTNYSSKKEITIKEELIESERTLLHTDLKNFIKPIHTIETNKFIVRVDLLEDQKYRYASWSKESDMASKPDLVINNGELTPDGSGGNHYFTFTNGVYRYKVSVNIMGADETPPFNLEVTQNDKVILYQPAELKE